MSRQYFKATIEYDNNAGDMDKMVLYIKEDNTTDYMTVVCEDGSEPSCSGTDWYCNALAHALLLQDYNDALSTTVVEECGWNGLPDKIKMKLDYNSYRKEHPLKLFEYPEDSNIKIWRASIRKGIDIQSLLESGMQPFDLILEDPDYKNGPILCPPKACPICGSRNVTSEGFNELEPYALAGAAGYIDRCNNCGYKHREITMMS